MSETILKISEMTPDSNLTGAEIFPFIRGGVEDNFITTLDNIKAYFNIPTKVSQLENDSKYITQNNVPTNVGDFNNNVGYITRDNTTVFTPTGDYNPSTKKYVDDLTKVKLINSGSMDDITQVGEYIVNPSIPGNPCSPYYCWLKVTGISDLLQEATCFSNLSVKRRSRTNNNWNSWVSTDFFNKVIIANPTSLITNRNSSGVEAEQAVNEVFGSLANFRNIVNDILINHSRYYFHSDSSSNNNCIELSAVNAWKSSDNSSFELNFIVCYYSSNILYTKRITVVVNNGTNYSKFIIVDLVNSDNIRTLVKMTASEYASSSKDAHTAYFVTD